MPQEKAQFSVLTIMSYSLHMGSTAELLMNERSQATITLRTSITDLQSHLTSGT